MLLQTKKDRKELTVDIDLEVNSSSAWLGFENIADGIRRMPSHASECSQCRPFSEKVIQ